MKINDKIRQVMKEERFRSVDFGPVFNCAPNVAASRFYNGIATICDLVKIMNFMGGEVIIRSHNGTEIPLTVEDVMADKAERKERYIRYTTKKPAEKAEVAPQEPAPAETAAVTETNTEESSRLGSILWMEGMGQSEQ